MHRREWSPSLRTWVSVWQRWKRILDSLWKKHRIWERNRYIIGLVVILIMEYWSLILQGSERKSLSSFIFMTRLHKRSLRCSTNPVNWLCHHPPAIWASECDWPRESSNGVLSLNNSTILESRTEFQTKAKMLGMFTFTILHRVFSVQF